MSNFFRLLAAYAPTSQNSASYDEHVHSFAKKLDIDEIYINNELIEKLCWTFMDKQRSIVVSGSAGDGKTYILRKLFEELSGDSAMWKRDFIPQISYNGFTIKFIKDFTEIKKAQKLESLEGLYSSIFKESKELYVIAANDGILIDTIREHAKDSKKFKKLLSLIENHIQNPRLEDNLILLDLSQTSCVHNFELLLQEILKACERYESDCPSLSDESLFCPIHSNISLLKSKQTQKQLISIIRSCDLNYNHITIRKLFMLITNMILGGSSEKRIFNSCEMAIKHYKTPNKKSDASFYNNIFADNLTKSKQDQTPFRELRELRIGYETSNNIDNFILYGDIESPKLHREKLSNPFFDIDAFNGTKESYLLESNDENSEEMQNYLIFLRRHLFFNSNKDFMWGSIRISTQNLTSYRFSQLFYEGVILPLKRSQEVSKGIIKSLALGLNRIFLGELLSRDGSDRLFIATSLTKTTSKLSAEILSSITFNDKNINQGIHLRLLSGFDEYYHRVNLEIEFGGECIAKLELDLYMFEFLQRVADGILPTSFSAQYYERVLSFKAQIINHILSSQESELCFNLFELNDLDGTLKLKRVLIEESGYVKEG